MLSFDTDVLVYATDRRAEHKRRVAADLLREAASFGAAMTEQCIMEYLDAAVRLAQQPFENALSIVREWLENFVLLVPADSVVEDAFLMLQRYRLSVWDARLLAVCAAHGCDFLFSEDLQDNAVYGGVRVLNPFNSSNARTIAEILHT